MRTIMVQVAAVLLTLWPAGIRAQCVQNTGPLALGNLTETFETPGGTDNQFEVLVDPGNTLDPNFQHPNNAIPLWGKKSGRVIIGPDHGAAFWLKRDAIESPTGYQFTASYVIVKDGLLDDKGITLAVSKPLDSFGHLAAWRLYFAKFQGQLYLMLVLGFNSDTNNPSTARYHVHITTNNTYDVAITYDTKRRFYLWSVNGQEKAAANMPCDYPLIATKIIGSSGSSIGRNSTYIVDNVRWYELPE